MTRTLDVGPVRLAELPGAPKSIQVASGIRADGELVVVIRLGELVVELSPDGAADLGNALVIEAAIARMGEGAS
jgi:hypothetical protein